MFYLLKREKAYFLLDVLPRLFLPWATGYEKWDGIVLAGQNRGRQVTSGTLLVTFPLSPASYSSTFLFFLGVPTPINFISYPSLGNFSLSWVCFGRAPCLAHGNTQPRSVLTVIPCNAICEDDTSPWRTFRTILGFPVFSLFLILSPLLTQSIILGRRVSLVCPFRSVGNTILLPSYYTQRQED